MKKISLLFPGQGSQYIGMGKKFFESSNTAKRVYEEASDAIGINLMKLCFESNIEELTKTENTQPALLTTSVAMFNVYMEQAEYEPTYLAGHSLGEISALVCAGGITLWDATKIVRQRGKLMQESVSHGDGAMAAIIGLDSEIIAKQCIEIQGEGEVVSISNFNSPDQTVISGYKSAVEKLCQIFKSNGIKYIPLKVSAPFHCQLMNPAAMKFKDELSKYKFHPLKWSVISNVNGLPYTNEGSIIDNLYNQIIKPVKWVDIMNFLKAEGIEANIEMGPKEVLKNLSIKNCPEMVALSYDKEDDIEVAKKLFEKKNQKRHLIKLLSKCLAIAVCTPNNNWNNEAYQKGVVEPYKRVEKIVEELEWNNKEPTADQINEAIDMLKSVFTTKGTPIDERKERYKQIKKELDSEGVTLGDLITF